MPRWDPNGVPSAPYLYNRPVKFHEFAQVVRRYRPSQLLPAIGRVAIDMASIDRYLSERYRVVTPWALAAAAKVSIERGTEDRKSTVVTDDDVTRICAAFAAVSDPPHNPAALGGRADSFFARAFNEQLTWQVTPGPEAARTYALFDQALATTATHTLDESKVLDLLGCTVPEYIGAGFLLWTAARSNGGWFNFEMLDVPDAEQIYEQVPKEVISHVLRTHFAVTAEEFRAECESSVHAVPHGFERHQYNPLVARPFVQMDADRWLAPQAGFIIRKLSPDGIYYAGGSRFGNAFTDDVGRLLESYVGLQLRQLPGAQVVQEIVYDNHQRSVDFFVIWPNLVVLIEVKSARLNQRARLGLDDLVDKLRESVGKAFKQIENSSRLIDTGHSAFRQLPTDRPRVAMFITLESIWVGNMPRIRELIEVPEPMPTSVANIRELERLVALASAGEDVATLLSEILGDSELRTWSLSSALREKRRDLRPKNPVIDGIWQALPWSSR